MITAGIDIGSTYTKAVLVADGEALVAATCRPTGFRLNEAARAAFDDCLEQAGVTRGEVRYVVSTGIGRHQTDLKDNHVTDLTATARGARMLFPATRSVLDIGGQTMKCSRLGERGGVQSFRLNDKCAAGTGAFLEKTARYMGYDVEEMGILIAGSREPVPISGVCAVFAESEVINQLSLGTPPGSIMRGAIESLVERAVQLLKRLKAEPDYTLVGGILRFDTMRASIERALGAPVNVPPPERVQMVAAYGAAVLGAARLLRRGELAQASGLAMGARG